MVEGAIEEQHAQPGGKSHVLIMPRVDPDGEVQEDAEGIEQGRLFQEFMVSRDFPGRLQQPGGHELSCHHEEKGHREPGQDPGQEEIRPLADGGERRGMDCDY